MKLLLLFVAIFGVATAAAVPATKVRATRSLSDDWADFYALVDKEAVLELIIVYLAEDAEVQHAVAYMQTDDFKNLVVAIGEIDEFIDFLNFLQAGGLDVYTQINRMRTWLGLDELVQASKSVSVSRLASTRITGGIAGLWADLKAILPLAELRALFEEKLQTSQDFADLVALLSSDKAQNIYDALKANEEYQHIRESLVAAGLDIDYFFDWLKSLIGYA